MSQIATLNSTTGLEIYNDNWVKKHAKDIDTKYKAKYYLSIAKTIKGEDFLDIGCGSGIITNLFCRNGYNGTGIDLVGNNIAYARKHFHGHYITGDLKLLIKYGWQFDIILISHVLEHIDNVNEYLQEIWKLLIRNGSVIISVPNLYSYDVNSFWRPSRIYEINDSNHKNTFCPESIYHVLIDNNFKVRKMETRTYKGQILLGIITTLGRKTITGKIPETGDKAIISKGTSNIISNICNRIPSRIFDKRSEKSYRGTDIIVVAKRGDIRE